jgi:hypothetical protein
MLENGQVGIHIVGNINIAANVTIWGWMAEYPNINSVSYRS